MAGLAADLRQTTARTDGDFFELGRGLKQIHDSALALSESTLGTVGMVRTALDAGRLTGEDGLTARSVAELRAGLTVAGENLGCLRDVTSALEQLQRQGTEMGHIGRALQTSRSCFAIESARSPECQQAFGAFNEELRKLAEKIASLGESIGNQAAGVYQELLRISGTIGDDLGELRILTERSERVVRATADEVQQVLDSAWVVLDRAGGRSKEIGRHAGRAAYHLQFGDITRQKLEHLVAAIAQASEEVLADRVNGAARAVKVMEIQAGQLRLVLREIREAREELLSAFEGLASETARYVEDLRGLELDRAWGTAGGGALKHLEAGLGALQSCQSEGRRLCAEAHAMSQQANESSIRLSQYLSQIQEINREVHLQALNAIIKTVLLGDQGRTLGVLSVHVHAVSEESSRLIRETVRVLETVRCQAQRSPSTAEAGRPGVREDVGDGIRHVREISDQIREMSRRSEELVARQLEDLGQVRNRIEFLSELEGALEAGLRELGALVERYRPRGGGGVVAEEVSRHAARYTMETERRIHRRVMSMSGGGDGARGPSGGEVEGVPVSKGVVGGPVSGSRGTGGEFGDNVELF